MAEVRNLFEQDHARAKKRLDILRCMQDVKARAGKSYRAQLGEMLNLSLGDGRISAQDYFYYRLYDDERVPAEEKRRFISDSLYDPVTRKCCDPQYWATAGDKLVAYTILGACGAPIPEIQAIFCLSGRNCGPIRTLRSIDALAHFLHADARFPIFAKPIAGVGSFGACRIEAARDGELILDGGRPLPIDRFAAEIDAQGGYLLQSMLRPHSELQEVAEIVSTIRVIVIFEAGQPQIIHTIWKIPAGGNIADNFWREGNILADIDIETGIVRRAMRGIGPSTEELSRHPDSDATIVGRTLPLWRELRSLCLDSAPIFIALRFQSWDIALCPEGPVIVEVNNGSAFTLPQLATGRGMLTDRFRAFLSACGYKLKRRP